MKKIVHFSDIHIGCEYKNHKGKQNMNERFNEIIDCLILAKGDKPENYIVVITGDIVDDATDENFKNAKICLKKLTDHNFKWLLVPGNHDYRCRGMADPEWRKEFNKRFFEKEEVKYPIVNVFDEIAFIGLDSMEGEMGTEGAEGSIGKSQLRDLEQGFEEQFKRQNQNFKKANKVVVYLHHHVLDPIPKHKLRDADVLERILKNNKVDALLFGHLHHGKKWHGWAGIRRVYDAGSTTKKSGSPGFHRIIDLSNDNPMFDYDADFHGEYSIETELSLWRALSDLIKTRFS